LISSIVHLLGFINLWDGSRRKSKERMQSYKIVQSSWGDRK